MVAGAPGTLLNAGDINDEDTITGQASSANATMAHIATLADTDTQPHR